jgi:toxin ParE1/3/4
VRLRWSVAAWADLAELRAFIAAENPTAASQTIRRVRETARRVQDFPFSGAVAPVDELRQTSVPATPFRMVYRIEADVIVILAVWHGARQWPPSA